MCSVFMRFLRPSVRITREHAQTHAHLYVPSEGAGRDWATARRGARLALVSLIICGSVNPRARAFTRRWAITLPITFIAVPEETARPPGRRAQSRLLVVHCASEAPGERALSRDWKVQGVDSCTSYTRSVIMMQVWAVGRWTFVHVSARE